VATADDEERNALGAGLPRMGETWRRG
jgi:hypothetical protein